MRTTEEQITAMHQRADELSRQRERNVLSVLFVLSVTLLGCVTGLSVFLSGTASGITDDVFTGASLLDESIGGYVAAAVFAFMAGVTVTVICSKLRKCSDSHTDTGNKPDLHPERKEGDQK